MIKKMMNDVVFKFVNLKKSFESCKMQKNKLDSELSLDTWITASDAEHKYNLPYFNYRICCNHNVNGEMSLLKSIIKNIPPDSQIFDVGATGSCFPSEIKPTMQVHLFDPEFKPSGSEWCGTYGHVMYAREVDYSGDNVHVNVTAVDAGDNSLGSYCASQGISHINFLKIDTDGHDLGVLRGLGDVTVDMVQFEYDNHYRVKDIRIEDMFDALPGWHFYYILPSGLLKIDEMRTDFIYTNIFACKEEPVEIIRDFEPLLVDKHVRVDHIGEFMSGLYWEAHHISPDTFKNSCITIDAPDRIDPLWNLEHSMAQYSSIYDN